MRARGFGFAFLLTVALTVSAADDPNLLFSRYLKYVTAIESSDLETARSFLSSAKLRNLAGKTDEEVHAALNVLSPKEDFNVRQEIFDGDDATLIVIAKVAGNDAVGRIEWLREEGEWKVLSELWDIGGDPEQRPGSIPKPKNEEQRAAIRELRAKGYAAPGPEFLVMSAGTGDLEALKLFVKAGYSVDTVDNGTPAIVNAAMGGQADAVLYLIEAGAKVNAEDEVHTTALMRLADQCDMTHVVNALLKAGARTDIKSAGGATALQLAEWAGCADNAKAIAGASR